MISRILRDILLRGIESLSPLLVAIIFFRRRRTSIILGCRAAPGKRLSLDLP